MKPCYNLDELGLDNCHMHTNYSTFAKSEMSVTAIIQAAKASKLKTRGL